MINARGDYPSSVARAMATGAINTAVAVFEIKSPRKKAADEGRQYVWYDAEDIRHIK